MLRIIEKVMPKSLLVKIYKGIPISLSLKKKIIWHANRRFLVAIQGIILNDKGEILLLKHTYRDAPWGMPGGWMNYEQPQEGLEREVFEETSLRIKSEQILDVSYGNKPHRVDIYIKGIFTGGEFKKSAEVSDYGFYKIGEWPDGMPDKQKRIIENICKKP